MTRPDFCEGLHPQLDCDLVNKRKLEYMTQLERTIEEDMVTLNDFEKLERERDQLKNDVDKLTGLLQEGSGLVMESTISDAVLQSERSGLLWSLRHVFCSSRDNTISPVHPKCAACDEIVRNLEVWKP